MGTENRIQAIAAKAASSAAEDFLDALPPDVSDALSPGYLHHLEEDLQAELFSLIQSRLLWSYQAVQLELENPQHEVAAPPLPPAPDPVAPLAQPEYLQRPSAGRELLAELRSGLEPTPTPSAADLPPRKRIVTPRSRTYEQSADPAPQSSDFLNSTTPNPATQAQQPAVTEENPRPYRRRRGQEPQPSREEIIRAYNIPPEWMNPSRDPDAKPRRRRRTSAAMA